ncbi:MAG: SGNH/GDSL hydrolase family protein [Gallionellaceae bacterium]|jgi:phospholipase/lecithinase/hemolysin
MRLYKLILAAALSLTIMLPAYAGDISGIQGPGIKFGSQAASPSAHGDDDEREHGKYPKIKFRTQISFGDSLSDVGTYAVGTIAALGGGQFTVNYPGVKNWTAWMAAEFGLAAPCAAQTGLDGDPAQGFSVMPPVNHAGCTGYAQGGARVTSPVGIGNKLTGGANVALGFLTVPVVQQIQNHLNLNAGKFNEDEIVFVMAGANDVFFQLGLLQAGATDPATAITSMAVAANELASAINTQIVGKGARYVVVLNIPNIAITPLAATFDASSRGLVEAMVNTFNSQLQYGVAANHHVLYVDAYADSYYQYINPGAYGLSNVTDTACDLSPYKNPLESSLICTPYNLIPGVTDKYLFSDRVHPTPYGYSLIANLVRKEMLNRGWRWHKHRPHGRQ